MTARAAAIAAARTGAIPRAVDIDPIAA